MRKLVPLVLSLTLAGCGAFQPVPTPTPSPQPTPTPQVVIETVLVTVIPTREPTLTPEETATLDVPPILLTLGAVTDTPASEATLAATPAPGEVEVPASLLGGVFSRIVFSTNRFSLRCEPKVIRFDATISDMHIRLVEFYYRIRGKTSTFVPDWTRGGALETDGTAHFWLDYAASDVVPDNRKVDGWFEVEFVGFNNLNQAVGRTEAITELVTYSLDCP